MGDKNCPFQQAYNLFSSQYKPSALPLLYRCEPTLPSPYVQPPRVS